MNLPERSGESTVALPAGAANIAFAKSHLVIARRSTALQARLYVESALCGNGIIDRGEWMHLLVSGGGTSDSVMPAVDVKGAK
jgi:hypothetical protein